MLATRHWDSARMNSTGFYICNRQKCFLLAPSVGAPRRTSCLIYCTHSCVTCQGFTFACQTLHGSTGEQQEYVPKREPECGETTCFSLKSIHVNWVWESAVKCLLPSVTFCAVTVSTLLGESTKCFSLNILFICFQRGKGREIEKERNINGWLPLVCPPLGTCPATQAYALDWESNR